MRFGEEFGFGFAEAHGFAARALHLPRQEEPCGHDNDQRQPVDEKREVPGHAVGQRLGGEVHALFREFLDKAGIVRRVALEEAAIGQRAGNFRARDHDRTDPAALDFGQELAVAHFLSGIA